MRVVLLWVLAGVLTGCQVTRADARDRTAEVSCRRYETCEGFGQGKTYQDKDTCLLEQKNFWNGLWPADKCEEKISSQGLDSCHKAIEITDCRNVLDLLNTAFNKCGTGVVCTGP